ncbi:MotA/TolQ/ExbB proton channel family protein [Leisingera caerulea]|uniref:MotA/TolQ/ExbB proton channel family protein n=1 Tax=Leisingera caerulea TaxID=506591 RepID=A0A9Q9HL72_LEICA|nr:MotA/TolQ/ExbB proton channel family protein [Leisingera caerulea]UWQ56162.1 MotA/TolQ/ExbB proton channel family protein [Leisingera caerulea]
MTNRAHAAVAAVFLTAPLFAGPVAAQDSPAAPVPQIAAEAPAVSSPVAPAAPAVDVPAAAAPAGPSGTDAALTEPADDVLAAQALPPAEPLTRQEELAQTARDAAAKAVKFLRDGGPSIWAIAALSVITLALILWKIWRLALIGAWSRGKAGRAVEAYERGETSAALAIVKGRIGIRSRVVATALTALSTLPEDRAREETARVAKLHLGSAATGLGALELITTIAPLLGLLGTVLGMIAAFQALQAAGSRADPALLAGGIWEALLTTAAGMAVAIPASAALTWFEAVISRIRRDIEDSATRLFVAAEPADLKLAAE